MEDVGSGATAWNMLGGREKRMVSDPLTLPGIEDGFI